MAQMIPNGAVKLYHNNTLRFYTNDSGVRVNDSNQIQLGSGGDMYLTHTGSHAYITNTTGQLIIAGDETLLKNQANNEVGLKYTANGAVDLYYDDSNKFSTTSVGAKITNNHDLRFESGSWTGESAGKIQHHSSYLYIQGGSNGIFLRHSDGTNRWLMDSSGHFYPSSNNAYDIGTSSNRVRNIIEQFEED